MNSIFDGLDNHLDPNNPSHLRILEKRTIANAWEQHVAKHNSSDNLDFKWDPDFDLQLPSIWLAFSISSEELAHYPNRNSRIRLFQEVAMRVLTRRNLYFPAAHAFAIANSDEPEDDVSHLESAGICICLNKGFDLCLPVTLTRENDANDFDLLFAARLAQTAPMQTFGFLDYHFSQNFQGDLSRFKSYLQVLILQYGPTNTTSGPVVLTDSTLQLLELWQAQKVQPSESELKGGILVKSELAANALFTVLAPYFEPNQQTALQTLISGGEYEHPLFFKGTCSQFVHVFQEACDQGLVISLKTEVRDWIVNHFNFKHTRTKAPSVFAPELVYKILTRQISVKRPINTLPLQLVER